MRGREKKAAYPPETQIQGRRLRPAGKVRLILRVVDETDRNAEDVAATDAVGAGGPNLDELCPGLPQLVGTRGPETGCDLRVCAHEAVGVVLLHGDGRWRVGVSRWRA